MKLINIMKAVMAGHFKGHFGQYAEDTLVRKLFAPRKRMESCLDVGAYHPFKFNNTAYFWMCGWRCVNVDANPKTIELFNRWRTSDINIHAAVITNEEIAAGVDSINLHLPDRDDKGHISAVGTVSQCQADSNNMSRKIVVPAFSINQIIEANNLHDVSYINIDIEGYDDKVLMDIDFDKIRPKVVSVEQFGEDVEEVVYGDVAKRMREHGYLFHSRASYTSIYVRKD